MTLDNLGLQRSEKIDQRLAPLIGLRLCIAHSAGNMRGFHFGEPRVVGGRTIGEYALHIHCPWRLERDGSVLTGSADYYVPADDNSDPEWEPGSSLGHLQHQALGTILRYDPARKALVNDSEVLIVSSAHCSVLGDVAISMSPCFRLVLFPSSSRQEEWRLLGLEHQEEQFEFESGGTY